MPAIFETTVSAIVVLPCALTKVTPLREVTSLAGGVVGCVAAGGGVVAVGVALGARIQSEHLLQRHAASRAAGRYAAAICRGTTLTKNR